MADSLNTTNLSRRSILGTGIAAAGALLSSVTAKAADADAKLLQLYAAYLESEAKDNEAYAAWDEAQGAAKKQAGPVPALLWRSIATPGGIHSRIPGLDNPPMDREAIEDLATRIPKAKREHERAIRLQALEEWEARCAAARDACRVDELKANSDAAEDARHELWTQIANTPAQSITGVAIKLAVTLHWDDGLQQVWAGCDPSTNAECMILAARADALRLAGLPHTFGIDRPEGEFEEEEGA